MPRPRRVLTLPEYAELDCRSNFSFLSGASHPEELVARAHALRYAALAITDEGSLAGVVRAHAAWLALDEAERRRFKLIVGAEMQLHGADADADADVTPATATTSTSSAAPAAGPRLLLLAMSRRGYGNLVQWITVARRRAPKGGYRALCGDLEGQVPTAPMLAGLPGCQALLVAAQALAADRPFDTLHAQANWLRRWFGPERAALGLSLLRGPHDALLVEITERVAALTGLPIVATGAVRMHARSRLPLLDVLTATRLGRPVADCGLALAANAERHLRPRLRLAGLYKPEWLQATLAIASRCDFSLAELRYEYPREIVPAAHTPSTWLRELTERGARERYPAGLPASVRGRLEHELALIGRLGYEPYFLTVADIVQWARRQGILCQGRGSAANSAVCYCLGVTAVDPEQHQMLLFERFISAERNEPPDIDIDFEHQRREEVIQYIYRKYGRE
ncbi:MAG: PHP domain-containing protein, partial [Burkholderiales bacterium]|nr:PHP domain-containing protein [Burkholderiales bacterium]